MPVWEAFDYRIRLTYRRDAELINFDKRKFLTEQEILITQANYELGSEHYGCVIEESEDGVLYSVSFLEPFFKSLEQNKTSSRRVFNIGTGFGLANVFIARKGYSLHGIDVSRTMVLASYLKFVIALEDSLNLGSVIHAIHDDSFLSYQFTQSSLTTLPDTFAQPNSLAGVLVDSALQHVNHDDVYDAIRQWYGWLEPGGTLLFRVKQTDHGNVYVIHDEVGTRYYTSWTEEEIAQLLIFAEEMGFRVQDQQAVAHRDAVAGTPPFYQIVLVKDRAGNKVSKQPQTQLESDEIKNHEPLEA